MKLGLLFLFLSLVFPIILFGAEPPEATLPPVVITATRSETLQENVTTSVTVIRAGEIVARQAETILELLREVPGLDVVQSG